MTTLVWLNRNFQETTFNERLKQQDFWECLFLNQLLPQKGNNIPLNHAAFFSGDK